MNTEALAANGVFDGTDPVQVERLRAHLENGLFQMAREIAACGLVPTISLESVPVPDGKGGTTLATGHYNISVDVRYGATFYRDPKFFEFIGNRMKAEAKEGKIK